MQIYFGKIRKRIVLALTLLPTENWNLQQIEKATGSTLNTNIYFLFISNLLKIHLSICSPNYCNSAIFLFNWNTISSFKFQVSSFLRFFLYVIFICEDHRCFLEKFVFRYEIGKNKEVWAIKCSPFLSHY